MASLLEELQQQREQIRKHLEWLDRKIAELSKGDEKADSPQPVTPTPNDSDTAPNADSDQPSEEAKVPFVPDPEAPAYKAKTQGELRRAQFGCLALFILSTALFLFLLFGLPYLLPEKTEDTTEPVIEEIDIDPPLDEEILEAPPEEET